MEKIKANVCFLGGIYPKETENEIRKKAKTGLANAANLLQWKYINGLDEILEKPLYILNSMYIGSFPRHYKEILIRNKTFSHRKNCKDDNIGFLNLYGIKNISRYLRLKPYLKTWAYKKEDDQSKKIIFAYAMTYTFMKSIAYIKKCNPEIITCLIVPDLPEFMNTSNQSSLIYKFLKGLEIKSINKNLKYFDHFVFLTDQMSKKLGVPKDRYTVIEGMVEKNTVFGSRTDVFSIFEEDVYYICYTGTLHERYGILDLLKIMNELKDENVKLIICGKGDSEQIVEEYAQSNNNTIYLGEVDNDTVSSLLKNCHILVNPRPNNEEYTKYSFPSKTMEYLLSETPVIMHELDGIPSEYDAYLNYFTSCDSHDMAMDVKKIIRDYNHFKEVAKKGKEFVMSEKNNVFLVDRLIKRILNEGKNDENRGYFV